MKKQFDDFKAEYSFRKENVEDLYAIDGALYAKACINKMMETADIFRQEAFEQNKYGPDNTYPENE